MLSISLRNSINLKEFTKVKKLGEGAFGVTFLYTKGNEKIAVKHIKIVKNYEQDIKNEVAILEKISSRCANRHVLCFKQINHSGDGQTSIITEFLDGFNFTSVLKKVFPASNFHQFIDLVMSCMYQLNDAIEYIHSVGIVHYDIKPDNILLTENKILKLIDFGLARSGSNSVISTSGGTPGYIPAYAKSSNPAYRYGTIPLSLAKTHDYYAFAKTFYDNKFSIYSPLFALNILVGQIYKTGKYNDIEEKLLTRFHSIIDDFNTIGYSTNSGPLPQQEYNIIFNNIKKLKGFKLPRDTFNIFGKTPLARLIPGMKRSNVVITDSDKLSNRRSKPNRMRQYRSRSIRSRRSISKPKSTRKVKSLQPMSISKPMSM